jgi:voltage-gated potassium channel
MTNVVWFTIITMTTVGFGDIYPRSLTGRIIVVVLIIWGRVIVSLIIVVLTNSLTMVMS